ELVKDGEWTFSFLGEAVVANDRALHELRGWPWAGRFVDIGVQRIEVDKGITRQGYGEFLEDIVGRLFSGRPGNAAAPMTRRGIRWGMLGVETIAEAGEGEGEGKEREAREWKPYRLGEETDIVRQLYQRAAQGGVALDEVETVVASLSVAMAAEGQLLLPVLDFPGQDAANALHAINVALLAMTLGESLGMASHDVHAVGSAGLLHDIGLSQLPQELLTKAALTPDERARIQEHPAIGARMLLARGAVFDLAAIVAYEHHMRPDGLGFPRPRVPRELHYATRLVTVCDVFDALRTPRAYRPAWTAQRALEFLEEGAGSMFDAAIVRSFVALIRRLEGPALLASG
ncbi:MAG: HD domain-containing protein, partial [Gemmatimonadales bacterium]|nr:HD domain-containing protein [Gemmatimonadales bacterium]